MSRNGASNWLSGSSRLPNSEPATRGQMGEQSMAETAETLIVPTIHGDYEVERNRLIKMPSGLIGYDETQTFALLDLQETGKQAFKWLQCLERRELGFYVLPAAVKDQDYVGSGYGDLAKAAQDADLDLANVTILLVIKVLADGREAVSLDANLKAPILVDMHKLVAAQVQTSDDYAGSFLIGTE